MDPAGRQQRKTAQNALFSPLITKGYFCMHKTVAAAENFICQCPWTRRRRRFCRGPAAYSHNCACTLPLPLCCAQLRSRASRLALAERYLGIDISRDSFEEWPHGYPTVGCWWDGVEWRSF